MASSNAEGAKFLSNSDKVPGSAQARLGVDSYLEWIEKERIPVATGLAIDLFAVETADWPRFGIRGAAAHCEGRGDFSSMFVYDIPAGSSSTPQRHLFEEVIYVLEGRGSTQLELADGTKRSFEWGPRSFFAIPLNAKHRHFNGSGTHRALLATTTDMPLMMNLFHNEDFIFRNDFEFTDRIGKEEYYSGEGDLFMVRQGNDLWVTNFVPDLDVLELKDWSDRGVEATTIMFALAESSMHAHISEIATGTYKKAHRHLISDVHVTCVAGSGYSLLWYEGDQDFVRVDWRNGVVFPPHINQFHQHFAMSKEPARYVGTGLGSVRYPVTMARRKEGLGVRGEKQGASLSVKLGGMQIEYEDQDPRIHQIWLEEAKKHGVTPRMREPVGAR